MPSLVALSPGNLPQSRRRETRRLSRCARSVVRDLLQRHALPRDRAGHGAPAGAARLRGGVPRGADLLRADALQLRLRARGHGAGAALRARLSGSEAVVSPSASCVGRVREHAGVDAPVYELSEFLTGPLGLEDVGPYYPHRVTWHPTCHSLRVLRVGDAPLRLLRAVKGIDLVELPDARECCGFGGTFAVKNPDVSAAMLTDKIAHVLSTEAEVCTAGDSSCLMHIGGGLARQRAGVRTVHLAEILASTGG